MQTYFTKIETTSKPLRFIHADSSRICDFFLKRFQVTTDVVNMVDVMQNHIFMLSSIGFVGCRKRDEKRNILLYLAAEYEKFLSVKQKKKKKNNLLQFSE